MEGKYGYHDTSDQHRCAVVARRRLVRPRAVVLVSLPTISEQSTWRSVMMRPGVGASPLLESRPPMREAMLSPVCRIGTYAALVNPSERGRTDVVLTGPQYTH
jgi:hypothetical protein